MQPSRRRRRRAGPRRPFARSPSSPTLRWRRLFSAMIHLASAGLLKRGTAKPRSGVPAGHGLDVEILPPGTDRNLCPLAVDTAHPAGRKPVRSRQRSLSNFSPRRTEELLDRRRARCSFHSKIPLIGTVAFRYRASHPSSPEPVGPEGLEREILWPPCYFLLFCCCCTNEVWVGLPHEMLRLICNPPPPPPLFSIATVRQALGQSTLHAGHIAWTSDEAVCKVWQPFPSLSSSTVG
jgi:hypothetical protein